MAERSGFFNAQETSAGVYDRTYNAEDFSNVFRQFLGNGIMVSENEINSNSIYDKTTCNGLKPTKSGNNVQINTGYAFINGYWYYNDEILTIPINSEGTLVLEYSSSERKISLKIITGNLQKNDDIYDISIALIQSSGTSYTVTDSRSQFITTNLKAIQKIANEIKGKVYGIKVLVDTLQTDWERDTLEIPLNGIKMLSPGDYILTLNFSIKSNGSDILGGHLNITGKYNNSGGLAFSVYTTDIFLPAGNRETDCTVVVFFHFDKSSTSDLDNVVNTVYAQLIFALSGIGDDAVKFTEDSEYNETKISYVFTKLVPIQNEELVPIPTI